MPSLTGFCPFPKNFRKKSKMEILIPSITAAQVQAAEVGGQRGCVRGSPGGCSPAHLPQDPLVLAGSGCPQRFSGNLLSSFPKVLSLTPASPLPGDAQKRLDPTRPPAALPCPLGVPIQRGGEKPKTQTHGPYFVFKHPEKFATSCVRLSHHSPSPNYQETGLFSC